MESSRHQSLWPRRWVVEFALASALLLPPLILLGHSLSGDAAVYFTFIRNFFDLPFSYQPGTVSFGATSPLHVVLHAPVHLVFGEGAWLKVSLLVNYVLIVSGVVLINRAVRGSTATLVLCAAGATLARPLFVTASQFYETPLAFLSVSALLYLLARRRLEASVLVAGQLYLVRPELILVTAAADLYVLAHARRPRARLMGWIVLSGVPALLYHLWILAHTGQLVPSSIYARGLTALESGATWIDSLAMSLQSLAGADGRIYVVGFALAVVAVAADGWRRNRVALLLLVPLCVLYTTFPPLGYTPRYLLPLVPALLALGVVAIRKVAWRATRHLPGPRLAIVVALAVASMVGQARRYLDDYRNPLYDYDTLLLADLARELEPIAAPDDRMLIYEIQAQYHLDTYCYSLDGIVGSQLVPVLRGEQGFAEFIEQRQVRWVVTANSFNYRKLYDETLLEQLYRHDLRSAVGEVTRIDGLSFRKVLTNPVFADPGLHEAAPFPNLNTGTELRVYGRGEPAWAGHVPMWNSVYRVESSLRAGDPGPPLTSAARRPWRRR